jgi:hypothetical protein
MRSTVSLDSEKRKEPLVLIATAPNEVVANLWKDALEENGIKCLLKSVNLVTSMYTSPITLQYQVLVLASDAERAKEVLTPFLGDE